HSSSSHLGYSVPPSRSSPFRRAESPASPSPLRQSTPTGSPTKYSGGTTTSFGSPSRQNTPTTVYGGGGGAGSGSMMTPAPLRSATSPSRSSLVRGAASTADHRGNALSKLQPAQVRMLRDGFQILDRDCDGVVNREDVADMLQQMGLPSNPSDVAPFFPPSQPQTIALAAFLNSLAEALAGLSPGGELLSAFSAFDDDDSGQVDLAELRNALLATPPEPGERALTPAEVDKVMDGFTGRRAFNRNMSAQLGSKRGDVFKYSDFVTSVMGTNGGPEEAAQESQD
ncbi:EFh, partial [Geosmithia morbida]